MEDIQNTTQENPFPILENTTPNRSTALTILLILSFIVSGLFVLSYFIIGVSYLELIQKIQDGTLFSTLLAKGSIPANVLESYVDWADFYFSQGRFSFFIYSLLEISAFIGVYFMWKMRRIGFYFYSAAKILLLILPFILLGRDGLDIGALMFTALFVAVYLSYFKNFR